MTSENDKEYVGMGCCPICHKDTTVLIDRRMRKTFSSRERYISEPCEQCSFVMKNGGGFFIEVKDGESGDNPARTGYIVGFNKETRLRDNLPYVSYVHESNLKEVMGPLYKEEIDMSKEGVE